MKDDKKPGGGQPSPAASIPNRILGSLRDALNAASRDDRSGEITVGQRTEPMPKTATPDAAKAALTSAPLAKSPTTGVTREIPTVPVQNLSAADAVREAKAPTRGHFEVGEPTTRAVREPAASKAAPSTGDAGKTQVIRG